MYLEQTINREQKNTFGIIGSTWKKLYVAEWELIYHEMLALAVSNLHKELSGVKEHTHELSLHHEFSPATTDSIECKLRDMMSVITSHENPFDRICHIVTIHR